MARVTWPSLTMARVTVAQTHRGRVALQGHIRFVRNSGLQPLWSPLLSSYSPASANFTGTVVSTATASPFNTNGRYFHCKTASIAAAAS
jgi:hypothetical protein